MRCSEAKRIVTLLLIAAVCFTVLFSLSFIAFESHHDCLGENCIICSQINLCENLLRSLSFSLTAFLFSLTAAHLAEKCREKAARFIYYRDPVSLKVELLD